MLRTCLSILLLFVLAEATGQALTDLRQLTGKTFVSRRLQYFKVLNVNTIYSSINEYHDTVNYFLRNDTLFFKDSVWQSDHTGTQLVRKQYDYQVLKLAADTLKLRNVFRYNNKPFNWEDTLVFVNIETIKEPVAGFRFIQLKNSGPRS